MISEMRVQELQNKKRQLQSNLNDLLNSKNYTSDDVNELRSEILHINKLIEKKVGNKELKRQEEVRKRKSGVNEINIKAYYSFKSKYKKISEMAVATNRILKAFDSLNNTYTEERVKVKV